MQLRQLFDASDEVMMGHFQALKAHKVANSYTLLAQGRTPAGRRQLAEASGVPDEVILDLAHRADITRMPWVAAW